MSIDLHGRFQLRPTARWAWRLVASTLCLGMLLAVATARAETLGNADYTPPTHRGYQLLTTNVYTPAEFPVSLFENIWQVWPPELKQQAASATPAERRRLAFSRYGFVEAPERGGQGPPLNAVEHEGNWVMNCLACHGGKVAGRTMPGLGNSHYAFQTLYQDVAKAQLSSGKPLNEGDLMGAIFPLGRTNGVTNAQILAVALTAMRDLDLNFTPRSPTTKYLHHDLDAPAWWLTKKKKMIYSDGYVQKTHRVIMQFTLSPANSGEQLRGWDDDFREILAWIESIEAPKYPWPVDASLAQRGQNIFQQHCAECHGSYGPGGVYPEKTVPIADLGTDPVRLQAMPLSHREFLRDSWLGEYGQLTIVPESVGYVAPPLDGVWASAPYFHNGSVPTLWHVLHPAERPAVWRRSEDGYDTRQVGLEVETWPELPSDVRRPDVKRQYFETRLAGKSAAGHTFPDALSEDEKTAVLEYLKTL